MNKQIDDQDKIEKLQNKTKTASQRKSNNDDITGEFTVKLRHGRYKQIFDGNVSIKRKTSVLEILDIVTKIISIVAIAAVVIGFLVIFTYLHSMKQISIFPDLIRSPTVAITIFFVYFVLAMLVAGAFLFPYFSHILLNDIRKNYINLKVSSRMQIGLIAETGILYLMGAGILTFYLYYFYIIINIINKITDLSAYFNPPMFITSIFFLLNLLIFIRSSWLFLKSGKYSSLYVKLSFILALSYAILISITYKPKIILEKIGFIQKLDDSSWYLLHADSSSDNGVNGMTADEINRLGGAFQPEQSTGANIIDKSNALFGYMAWNLGDTKVFCPQSVNFFSEGIKDNNEKLREYSKKCLVINGKYLQSITYELLGGHSNN